MGQPRLRLREHLSLCQLHLHGLRLGKRLGAGQTFDGPAEGGGLCEADDVLDQLSRTPTFSHAPCLYKQVVVRLKKSQLTCIAHMMSESDLPK